MNKKQPVDLFKAAFYADLDTIKQTVKEEEDLVLHIPVPEGSYKLFWKEDVMRCSILDMLNWIGWGIYPFYEQDNLFKTNSNPGDLYPRTYYHNTVACIDWICKRFSICNYKLKDYSYFRPLRHFLFEGEGWMNDSDISEALAAGYRLMDLELMNLAACGNGIACYKAIKRGANYRIDLLNRGSGGDIEDMLSSAASYEMAAFVRYVSDPDAFQAADPYDVLTSLFKIGVGQYILDILKCDAPNGCG